ncbi:MAG: CBS domain-containing protein [Sphingopyxis sp.]|nr:CBS domain-containing protein [Sphingopyxis sp.]
MAHTAEECMTQPVVTVNANATIEEVSRRWRSSQIRRVPVVDERGCCMGIIAAGRRGVAACSQSSCRAFARARGEWAGASILPSAAPR